MSEDGKRVEVSFNEHFGDVLADALRRCSSREDAEDVVAETFSVAWHGLDDLPRGDEARLGLFGTARLVRTNGIRDRGRRQRLQDRLRQRARRDEVPRLQRARDRLATQWEHTDDIDHVATRSATVGTDI